MFSLHLVAKFSRRPRSPRHWPFFRASAIAMAAAWLPISRYFQVIPGESLVKIRGGWPMMAWCSTQDATCRAPCRYQQTSWSVCLHFSVHSPQNGQSNHSNGQSQHVSTGCNTIPYFCTSILLFLQNSPDHAKVQVVNNRVLFSKRPWLTWFLDVPCCFWQPAAEHRQPATAEEDRSWSFASPA